MGKPAGAERWQSAGRAVVERKRQRVLQQFCKLEGILHEELATLDQLVELAERQEQVLTQRDHEALVALVREQEAQAARLDQIEEAREEACGKLASKLGLPRGAALDQIVRALPPELTPRGKALHAHLRRTITALAQSHRCNAHLIRQALHGTRHAISLLKHAQQSRAGSYAPPTAPGGRPSARALVNCTA